MNNKQKLFLHIGTPKTGTTAIQAFCYRNKEMLEKYGYYYPTPFERETMKSGKYAQSGNVGDIAAFGDNADEIAKQLLLLIGTNNKTILSSEEFVHYRHEDLGKIIKALLEANVSLEIMIIVYLRNQADYFESLYKEIVQEYNLTATPDEAFDYLMAKKYLLPSDRCVSLDRLIGSCNYWKWISEIGRYLDKKNIIIRNYDNLMKSNIDIIDDFFSCCGLDLGTDFEREKIFANPSMGLELLEAKRIINGWNLYGYDERIRDYFMQELRPMIINDESKKNYSIFANDQRVKIWNKYKDGNRELSEVFLGGEAIFDKPILKEKTSFSEKSYIDNALFMVAGAILQADKVQKQLIKESLERLEEIIRDSLKKMRSDVFINMQLSVDVKAVFDESKTIIGWGAGGCCNVLIDIINKYLKIDYVCDSDSCKWNTKISSNTICVSPDFLREHEGSPIMIFAYEEKTIFSIKEQINKIGEFKTMLAVDWYNYINDYN